MTAASAAATSAPAEEVAVVLEVCVVGAVGSSARSWGSAWGELGFGWSVAGFGLVERVLVVGWIEIDGELIGGDGLVVVDVDADDGAGDAGADGVEVAVDLGVVGGFVGVEIDDEKDDQDNENDGADCAKDDAFGMLVNVGLNALL